ncbi:C40 family peptidase [Pontibacter locisalis]|uniref:C40 family peptidase n=1 Tax=Pontibacter locisalis TaxID=1719035 RepID=A0ABW5INJ8_9BACT
MKKNPFVLLLLFLMSCVSSQTKKSPAAEVSPLQTYIDETRQQFAPDKRVTLFKVDVNSNVLRGETNMPEAKADLLRRLTAANIAYVDSIQVLPETELKGLHNAVVSISVANLRSEPKHSAELATQATMGTPLKVWKKNDGWYLVQTPDKYLAWVDYGGIALMENKAFADWQKGKKLLYTQPYGFAYANADASGTTVSDLVYGDVVLLKEQKKDFYKVEFPDGRSGYIHTNEATDYKTWSASRQPTEDNLVQSGKRLLGFPYLWGGTSVKGMDCSGFTKTVYFMNGLVLPRDASQQVHVGELVDTSDGWENLRPGDLLFFGTPASDGKSERVVHVGMWIGGDQEFIHSAGKVRINSMNPKAANYDDYELNRFLRAKRVVPDTTLLDLREVSLYE